ncbi:MAG: DUF2442 domain-containing protein [bacterium]
MSTLILETEPLAIQVAISNQKLIIELADGRSITIPLAWYPRLQSGSEEERQNWQLLGGGYAIEWPDLDEHIGVAGLLAGKRSGESRRSFEIWNSSRTTNKNGKTAGQT